MATAVIVIIYAVLAFAIAATIAIGLYRGRHIRWSSPGYNVFTGKWSDEQEKDQKPER